MKLTAVFLAIPLALGSGAVWADSMTTSETTKTNTGMPAASSSTESKTKVEQHDAFGDKTVVKHNATSQNADGSVSVEKSKTIEKSN